MKWTNMKREMKADKTSTASIPPAKKIKKKNFHKIYHLTKSIYSSVVRNSFSCLTVLLAVVWSPELGLYIFIFGWCVYWFVFLSYWSVSARFGSGRKREGGLSRVENRKEVWVRLKTGVRFRSRRNLGRVENERKVWVGLKIGGRLYRSAYAPSLQICPLT